MRLFLVRPESPPVETVVVVGVVVVVSCSVLVAVADADAVVVVEPPPPPPLVDSSIVLVPVPPTRNSFLVLPRTSSRGQKFLRCRKVYACIHACLGPSVSLSVSLSKLSLCLCTSASENASLLCLAISYIPLKLSPSPKTSGNRLHLRLRTNSRVSGLLRLALCCHKGLEAPARLRTKSRPAASARIWADLSALHPAIRTTRARDESAAHAHARGRPPGTAQRNGPTTPRWGRCATRRCTPGASG